MPQQQEEVDGLFDKPASKMGVSLGETEVRSSGWEMWQTQECPSTFLQADEEMRGSLPGLPLSCSMDVFSVLTESLATPRIC